MSDTPSTHYNNFLLEVKEKIRTAQYEAAKAVNTTIINLYWDIGSRLSEKLKTGWGKAVVETLSDDIQKEFPGIKGFSSTNLWYMKQFHEEYCGSEILQPLVGEISWTKHLVIMSKCKNEQERQFYILATKKYGWTKDVLIHKIELKNFEKFAIELKTGEFLPEYKGKMEFYLNVLNDTIKLPHENPAIGIIICKSKNRTIVEYALKDSNKPIGIATYTLTATLPESYRNQLPSGEELAHKLDAFIELSKKQKP